MKTIMKLFPFLALFILLISCSKDDDTTSSGNNAFFAVVDGTDFQPNFITGFKTSNTNTILLTGSMGTAEQIQIFVPADIQPGTYTWYDINSVFIQGYYAPSSSQSADDDGIADTGSISITKNDQINQIIEGTFSFTSEPTISTNTIFRVTEGEFSIQYEDL